MKVFIIALSTIAAVSTLVQPAKAEGGARFTFAPNVYPVEEPNQPKHMYSNNTPFIPSGHVPRNLLGADPSFLAKPAPPPVPVRQVMPAIAPIAQISTKATPNFTAPVPKSNPSLNPSSTPSPNLAQMPAAFNPGFGSPLSAPPALPMQQPNKPQAPTSRIAPAKANNAAKPSSKPTASASSHLSGRIRPRVQAGQAAPPAKGLPPVATYGSQGYSSGPYLPSISSGSGSSSNSSLSGRVLTPQRHHH